MQRVAIGLGKDRDGLMPRRFAVLMTRQAISPRLAMRIFENTASLGRGRTFRV